MDFSDPRTLLLLGAVGIGLVFGFTARVSGFCLRSALIEIVDRRAGRQAVTWLVTLAVAVVVTQALAFAGIIDLSDSIYLSTDLTWLALVVGGLVFGFGMVLTRGCGGRHLVLAAGGNLRSWIVLAVLGLTAYMTLRGILALPRTWLEDLAFIGNDTIEISLGGIIAGAESDVAPLAIAGTLGLACLVAAWRASRSGVPSSAWVAGIVIGLMIPAGWYVTGVLGFDEFEPVRTESVTFTAPVGNAIQYLLTYTGSQADFGITVVGLTIVGAFIGAAVTGDLKLEGFDTPGHLLRYAGGAAMMGFGGVLALGCTVGAGLSGVSTLSVASMLAMASIIAGGTIGHKIKTGIVGGRAPEVVPAE